MARIFISYSRYNLDPVKMLVQDLEAVGNTVWFDQTLTGGQRWWDSILSNIRECEIFAFALSPESLKSEACKNELAYVVQLRKPILPILLSDDVNVILLPHPLSEIQVIDYRQDDRKTAFAVIKAINSLPPPSPLPDPLPEPPPVPVSYLANLKERIDAAESLNLKEQIALVFELKAGLKEGRSPDEVCELLLRLKQRDDLLAKVATEIDAALDSIKDNASNQSPRLKGVLTSQVSETHEEETEKASKVERVDHQTDQGLRDDLHYRKGNGPTGQGAKTRRFSCPPENCHQLVAEVKSWLENQDFDCQQLTTESNDILLQITKKGSWRKLVGMSTALNVVLHQAGSTLTVEIGAGKWIDKAAVGTVSLFVLWPLAVTAGYGAWQQMKMPDKIFDFIGNRLVYR